MIKPWSERSRTGCPAARETVQSVFRGIGLITGSDWPEQYARELMEDYPVFDKPGEYTFENLVHYVYSRIFSSPDRPEVKAVPDWEPIGKPLEEVCPWAESPQQQWDAFHDILYRLMIEPILFLAEYEEREE